jgi:hypothetical protein
VVIDPTSALFHQCGQRSRLRLWSQWLEAIRMYGKLSQFGISGIILARLG